MYRAVPVGNKLLSQVWQDYDQQIHVRKLREMRPTINTTNSNLAFSHLKKKSKKEQMLEGGYIYIYIYRNYY